MRVLLKFCITINSVPKIAVVSHHHMHFLRSCGLLFIANVAILAAAAQVTSEAEARYRQSLDRAGQQLRSATGECEAAERILDGLIARAGIRLSMYTESSFDVEALKASLDRRVGELVAEKDSALADLRQGARCSQCNRTKTEISKTEPFEAHLRTVSGTAVPVTPEEIDAKSKEYDLKIRGVEGERNVVINAEERRKRGARQIMNLWPIWSRACRELTAAFQQRWISDKNVYERRIFSQNEELKKVENQLFRVKSRGARSGLIAKKNRLRSQITLEQQNLRRAYDARKVAAASLFASLEAELTALRKRMASLKLYAMWSGSSLSRGGHVSVASLAFPNMNGSRSSAPPTGW